MQPRFRQQNRGCTYLMYLLLSTHKCRERFALLEPLVVLGGGGELHITGGVQRSLDGVLNDADDETDADDLHSDIIGDAEQRACHRDEQQRATRDAGSAARAQRGHDGQQDD